MYHVGDMLEAINKQIDIVKILWYGKKISEIKDINKIKAIT